MAARSARASGGWRVPIQSAVDGRDLLPAAAYQRVDDLWVITSYFNSAGYRSKEANLEEFIAPIKRGSLNWAMVECAFAEAPHRFRPSKRILQLRAESVLWQKERLLNRLVETLPDECTKVAWVDADVLFTNPNWAVETSAALEHHVLVQPYAEVVRLPPRTRVFRGDGRRWPSFAARYSENPGSLFSGKFDAHGHTGFAWAARRELLLDLGLYDACIAGGGDHFLAHAACGDWSTTCALRVTGGRTPLQRHASAWAERWHAAVERRVGYVDGALLHLWHGDYQHRQYNARGHELAALGFDPEVDLRLGTDGCWEWASDNSGLHRWALDYFEARFEDGAPVEAEIKPSQSAERAAS